MASVVAPLLMQAMPSSSSPTDQQQPPQSLPPSPPPLPREPTLIRLESSHSSSPQPNGNSTSRISSIQNSPISSVSPLTTSSTSSPTNIVSLIPSWVPHFLDHILHSKTSSSSNTSSNSSVSITATPDSPRRRPRASPAARALAERALSETGIQQLRLALRLLRARNPTGISFLARKSSAAASLSCMIDPSADAYATPGDRTAIIVAAHTLCNHVTFRERFLDAGGLDSLCRLLASANEDGEGEKQKQQTDNQVQTPAHQTQAIGPNQDRPSPPVFGRSAFAVSSRPASASGLAVMSGSTTNAPGGIHRAVWNAAIRTIAKLMVCSVAACAKSIDSGALALLAKAALPGEPMDIRLRAAAGLAAIAAWSGPRRAVEIVETDNVVRSMSSILAERDERIPNDLRSATIDGLVVLSYRRHAKRVLQKFECEQKIKAAARHATVSGDYTAAARSTVAAGQLTGRSVDEYGFFVQDPAAQRDLNSDSFTGMEDDQSNADANGDQKPPVVEQKQTGLSHIKQQLLVEPYTAVEDLNVLEEIVHEEAGLLGSSPRDRHHLRRAARTCGVSADEIDFISMLDDERATQKEDDPATAVAAATVAAEAAADAAAAAAAAVEDDDHKPGFSTPKRANGQPSPLAKPLVQNASVINPSDLRTVAGLSNANRNSSAHSTNNVRPSSNNSDRSNVTANGRIEGTSPARHSRSSHRHSSSNFANVVDPDFDRALDNGEEDETASSTTAASSKSKILSPLLMFSSAMKKAAEKDRPHQAKLQKTMSQLTRETEHERIWKEVLTNRLDMLKREKGRSSRVVAYRELALVPVPPTLRRKLWPILLDTTSLRAAKPGLYKKLCEGGESVVLPDDIEHTIEADVTRTMPLHSLFWVGGAQVGIQSLRSILRAYARYVPEVGYCQGMSSIAAVFLMNAADEEEAFLMMVQFMSRFQYKRVFAPGFPLMMQWIEELRPLVAHYMPELNARLERENVTIELYADKWLITALSHNFPHRYLLRIWDLMFLGGSPKIILKACLAVLKFCEPHLMKMEFETMMPFLQRGFAEPSGGVLDANDPEPFITVLRGFRFLPDLPKSSANPRVGVAATAGPSPATANTANVPTPKQENPRERRRGAACLPCFRRSQTID